MFQAAAQDGDIDGMYNIAMMYENGEYVKKDITKAMKYYCLSGSYPLRNRESTIELVDERSIKSCSHVSKSKEDNIKADRQLKDDCLKKFEQLIN